MACDDGVQKFLPEGTRIGMTLEGKLDREDHVSGDNDTVPPKVSVGVLLVDGDKGWLIRRRRVSIRVRGVDLQTDEAFEDT
jgi:hypothetical protein